MLKQLSKRLVSPLSLGLDWQAQCLRMVLLQAPEKSTPRPMAASLFGPMEGANTPT